MVLPLLVLLGQLATIEFKPQAKFQSTSLTEVSGIARSNFNKDVFWVHNDSGDSARIFAVDRNGKPRGNTKGISISGAKNIDWEDIASGGGKLYIGDVGNNGNARRDLAIYVVNEPHNASVITLSLSQRLPVIYPQQTAFPPENWQFDCEATFMLKGKVHLLTKHRALGGRLPAPSTTLYRLDTQYTDRPNKLTSLDQFANLGGWVTAADASADGRWIAVLTHFPVASVWIFDTKGVADELLSKPIRMVILTKAKQCEAMAFDGLDKLIVTNEQGEIFSLKLSQIPPFKGVL